MQINWKELAQTKGYKSLKAAYIKDVMERNESFRSKNEYLRKFNWVISRAKHYAYHNGKSVAEVLDDWEEKRSYWWLNFYQDSSQPRFHSNGIKPEGIRGARKYYKRMYQGIPDGKRKIKERMSQLMQHQNKESNKKPRWSKHRKQHGY